MLLFTFLQLHLLFICDLLDTILFFYIVIKKIKTYVLPLCYQSIYPSPPLSSSSLYQCHLYHHIAAMWLWPSCHCVVAFIIASSSCLIFIITSSSHYGHSLLLSCHCGIAFIITALPSLSHWSDFIVIVAIAVSPSLLVVVSSLSSWCHLCHHQKKKNILFLLIPFLPQNKGFR
jgi:hypothetical protein